MDRSLGPSVLDLRPDSTFSLSWGRAGDPQTLVSGTWAPRADGVDIVVRESRVSTDEIGPVWAPEPGTNISVLLNERHATYLGVGGLVDLNWGY